MKKVFHNIKKKTKYYYQCFVRGYPDEDIYDLANATSRFVLPRLEHFALNYQGCIPSNMDSQEWRLILDDMIYAFKYTIEENKNYKTDQKRVKRGLKYFAKYYRGLWF